MTTSAPAPSTCSPHSRSPVPPPEVITQLHPRHRAIEFRKFLATIDKEVPAGYDVHRIVDNLSTDKTAAHPQIRSSPIPGSTCTSPRPVVPAVPGQRWFAETTMKPSAPACTAALKDLATDITTWAGNWNTNPKPTSGRRPPTNPSTPPYRQRITDQDD